MYSELYSWLKEQITAGIYKDGDKIPTEMELARQFSVSRDTVRKAIAKLEGEELLHRVKGNGTFIRLNGHTPVPLREKESSRLIGVLMTEIDTYIFPEILLGLDDVFRQYGYRTVLHFTNNKISEERKALLDMLEGDFAGYIIEPTKSALPQLNENLYQKLVKKAPVILIHAKLPGLGCSSLTMGDENGAFRLTTHLLKEGHRRIMIIVKADEQTGTMRYLGYARAFQEFGVPIPDDNIFWFVSDNEENLFRDFMDQKMEKAFRDSTAIICQDDRLAHDLKKYLSERGIERILCGFDDTALSAEDHITSVAHPKRKFGEEAAARLIGKIGDPQKDVSYDFEPEIIHRSV